MATNLRKYKYTGQASARPSASSTSSSTDASERSTPPPPDTPVMDAVALKSEILLSLKADISAVKVRNENGTC